MTNENEKKDEGKSEKSYYDYFAQLLAKVTAQQFPILLKLQGEYSDLGNYLKELGEPEDRIEKNLTILQRRFVAQLIADLYSYQSVVSGLGMLGNEIDYLKQDLRKSGAIPQSIEAIDKRTQDGIKKIDTAIARRLAQLLDMQGHEAMYDTGTNPSGSN